MSTDLSRLTAEEIAQFDGPNNVVLTTGTDVALYMRYSSERQSEQSIEGQLRDAIAYCKTNKYKIAAIYVDRATSAHKDISKRTDFLNMIGDADKASWKYVLVWKLDRFSRNRHESAIYKMRLKKHGVRVLSVTESISENPEGVILEAVLEGMAEFYSLELSQKITRGMRETALKCNSAGGQLPLGYKIEDHKLVIDPLTAPAVKKSFEMYAQGRTVGQIATYLNNKGYRTSKGAAFRASSFTAMFRNVKYIGTYKYDDIVIPNGIPAIISEDLFNQVQRKLRQNAATPGRGKAKVSYLLSGKLFCGHCGETMVGDSGHGRTATYHYYTCTNRKKHGTCRKKSLRKEDIEKWVAEDIMSLLTNEVIEELADLAVKANEEEIARNTVIPQLENKLIDLNKYIQNLTTAIMKGAESETIISTIKELERERKDVERQLRDERSNIYILDRYQVIYWLNNFKDGDIEDEEFKQRLFDLFVNNVTVWDGPDKTFKVTILYNLIPGNNTYQLSELEKSYNGTDVPPMRNCPNRIIVSGGMILRTTQILPVV